MKPKYIAPQIQRGFPVDIVRNTNVLTYLLTCLHDAWFALENWQASGQFHLSVT